MNKGLNLVINFLSAAALYASLHLQWLAGFNIFFIIIWLGTLNLFTSSILSKIFNLPKNYIRLLGLFLDIFLLVFMGNIFTSWWAFNNLTFFVALILTSIFIVLWSYRFERITALPSIYFGHNDGFWHLKNWSVAILGGLLLWGYFVIKAVPSGQYLISPWQVLPVYFLVIIFLALLIMFSLIFSKRKVWLILISIILTSFLLHAYLLVYVEGFGGDRWRHLGSEKRILLEMAYQPTLLTNDIWYQSVAGVEIPQALIAGPKISYGFGWTLTIMLAKISKASIFDLDKYLILFLWSFFMPLIAFATAWQFKSKKVYSLLAAGLTLVFYLLQYYGAQTVPISFSALYFMFIIGGLLAYLKNKDLNILLFLTSLVVLSYFGYSLGFIVLGLSLVWLWSLRLKPLKKIMMFWLLGFTIAIVEGLSMFSSFNGNIAVTEIINNLFIKSNLLFFEHGQILVLPNIFSPYLALLITLFLISITLIFIFKLLKNKQAGSLFVAGLSLILIINFLSSWIFLDGLHTLGRRINIYLILLGLIILADGLNEFINTKVRAVVVVLALSLIGLLTYASGPVLEATVTTNDTYAMKYIWSQIQGQPKNYCILADTWPLLALEAYSAKELVAGNFPSDLDYNQNERVTLLRDFILNPSLEIIAEAMMITQTKTCFVMINYNNLDAVNLNLVKGLLGQPQIFGDNLVWEYK